jgi:DNA-binding Lrp family transcriptional regulator
MASPPKNLRQTTSATDVDRIDRVILEQLQKNARLSYKELAGRAGVAPSTCLERVRSLRARGVITGFRAEVELARVGRTLEALVAIRFHSHSRELAERFVDHVLSLPETIGLFNVTGEDDYLLHVAVADAEHLRGFVLDRLGTRSEVASVRTSLVFEHVRKAVIEPLDASAESEGSAA